MAGPASAQMRTPDAVNELAIKPNPTASVTKVCNELDRREFSQLIQATCYSEINQAVVILVSGNAGDIPGQTIGEVIVKEFGKNYIPAVAFLENHERNKVSISYLLNGDFYGPYSGDDWQEGLTLLMRHAPQAWFLKSN